MNHLLIGHCHSAPSNIHDQCILVVIIVPISFEWHMLPCIKHIQRNISHHSTLNVQFSMRKKGIWNTWANNTAHANAFTFSRQRYFKMLYILIYSFNWVIVYSTVHPLTLKVFVEFALCTSFMIEQYIMLHLTYYTTVVVIYIYSITGCGQLLGTFVPTNIAQSCILIVIFQSFVHVAGCCFADDFSYCL